MAHIVTAHIVMAHTFMAHRVMACLSCFQLIDRIQPGRAIVEQYALVPAKGVLARVLDMCVLGHVAHVRRRMSSRTCLTLVL